MPARRIAIVGFGPRGVGALERLIAHQDSADAKPVEVTIFESHPTLGAGSGYDPQQEPFLLMNFPAAKIDLGWKSERSPTGIELPSFIEWASPGSRDAETWYPPRALVGQYLSTIAEKLLESATFPVQLVADPVVGLESSSSEWLARTPAGSHRFDEVMLTIGHAPATHPASSTCDLSTGDRIDIRGFGLTAIDLILQLTEGRGGRFLPDGDNRFRYVGSPKTPSLVLPHSRHGRPMLVKPELTASPVQPEAARTMIEQSRASIVALPSGAGVGQLASLLASLAEALLGSNQETAARWIAAALSGKLGSSADPAQTIERSLRVSDGIEEPDVLWALGLTWRSIYPAIVERFSHGGLPPSDARRFQLLAAELERLAFGPPPLNGAKILALVEAGVLDLSELDQPADPQSRTRINAVSELPGLRLHQQPLSGLFEQGAIRVPAGLRGIEVNRAAGCVGVNGEPTRGLSACGRLTEDWVIGNDTLDRSLHPEVDRWAAEVCARDRVEDSVVVAT